MIISDSLPLGVTTPRVFTPEPLPENRNGRGCPCRCGLGPSTSHGFRVISWARARGWRLHPWQRWLLIHALELRSDGRYRFRTVIVLVARQNGKTLVKMLLTLWRMYVQNNRLQVGIAQDLSQAREVMNEGLVPIMLGDRVLSKRFNPDDEDWENRRGIWHKTLNDEYIRLDSRWRGNRYIGPYGPRYLIKALNRRAGRGLWECRELNIDELREQTDFRSWSAVSKIVMAAPNSQIWAMSNAGDRTAVVLHHLRGVGLAGSDSSMFFAEWSGEEGCEPDDWDQIAQANPSLGRPDGEGVVRLEHEAINSALLADPVNVFRTEVLCQFVDAMDSGVDMIAWAGLIDSTGRMDFARSSMVAHASVDGEHVSLVAASKLDDGRVRLAMVREWDSTEKARRALPGVVKTFAPHQIGWFPSGPGSVLSATMRKLDGVPIKGAAAKEACMTLADLVKARRVLQPGHATLDVHMSKSSRVGPLKSWEFDEPELEQVDGAWAAAGAVHLVLNAEDPPPPSKRKII